MSSDLTTPAATPPAGSPELVVTRTVIEQPLSARRRLISGGSIVLAGVICILSWGLGAKSGDAKFGFSQLGDEVAIPTLHVAGRMAAFVLGALIIGVGGWQLWHGFSRRQMKLVLIVVLVAFVAAFLCWVGTGTGGAAISIEGLLQQTVVTSVPLILGALAGILGERTGVINVAIEGQLLVGAFAGSLFASISHNLGVGIVAAMLAGGLMGALLAVFAIRYQVNQVVLGVVLNVFAIGITGYLYDTLMAKNSLTMNNPGHLSPIKIPLLGDIPFIGRSLFNNNIIVYFTYLLIIAVDVALFRTRWGLRTRAVGEHPKAADTVGIKVLRTRYRNVMMGGLLAGLGGAYLTLGNVGSFTKVMTNGRGFIALAAVIFGRWSPRGAVGAALLFAFSDALGTVLSIVGSPVKIPSNFLLMLPFLATLFAVAGLVGKVQAPAADGEPYVT